MWVYIVVVSMKAKRNTTSQAFAVTVLGIQGAGDVHRVFFPQSQGVSSLEKKCRRSDPTPGLFNSGTGTAPLEVLLEPLYALPLLATAYLDRQRTWGSMWGFQVNGESM